MNTVVSVPLVGPSNVTAVATSYNQIAVTWLDMADISKQGVLQGEDGRSLFTIAHFCYMLMPADRFRLSACPCGWLAGWLAS